MTRLISTSRCPTRHKHYRGIWRKDRFSGPRYIYNPISQTYANSVVVLPHRFAPPTSLIVVRTKSNSGVGIWRLYRWRSRTAHSTPQSSSKYLTIPVGAIPITSSLRIPGSPNGTFSVVVFLAEKIWEGGFGTKLVAASKTVRCTSLLTSLVVYSAGLFSSAELVGHRKDVYSPVNPAIMVVALWDCAVLPAAGAMVAAELTVVIHLGIVQLIIAWCLRIVHVGRYQDELELAIENSCTFTYWVKGSALIENVFPYEQLIVAKVTWLLFTSCKSAQVKLSKSI